MSDFRYETGDARIAWAAVGENIRQEEVANILRFLVRPAADRKQEYDAQFERVMAEVRGLLQVGSYQGKLTLGSQVQALEAQVGELLGARYVSFLTNATAGFEIAYQYANLQPGDEVIAPAITFIATIAYPLSIGAKVVLADVDPRTLNMDPRDVARKITPKTKVIVPVHLGGYPVDMDPLMELAARHDLVVLEDAAHAFGAAYKGRMAGTIGHFGAFSFHEVKNITSLGEGGILCTNLDFGQYFPQARFLGVDPSRKIPNWLYDVLALPGKTGPFVPGNHSATEIQAVCLASQMERLKAIIAKREQAARYLDQRFRAVAGILPAPLSDDQVQTTYHLYLLQIDPDQVGADIQALKAKLAERGVVNIPTSRRSTSSR